MQEKYREEMKSNECKERAVCLMHILLLQKCLPAFVPLLGGLGLQVDTLKTEGIPVNGTAKDRLKSKS